MTQIITFGNFKGGVGKTTNSVMVSYSLAAKSKKTLLVDLDPQGNATNILLKTKNNIDAEVSTFSKSLMTCVKEDQLEEAIVSVMDDLDLLASAPDFSLYPRWMEKVNDYSERVSYFKKLLDAIKDDYEYIIIDIPPTISLITDSALYASDYCMIVMQTHEHSLIGAQAFLEYIQDEIVDTYHAPKLEVLGIIAVLMQMGAPVDEATMVNAKEEFGEDNIFKNKIHTMQRLKRYGITGITANSAHDKKVFDVYKKLTKEITEKIKVFEHDE